MERASMVSGIVHDDPGDYEGFDCPNNPDIAGIGVVVTYVFAALLTTSISIAAAVLDEMLQADTAFLHKRLNVLFSKNQSAESIRRRRFRRNVLNRLILALADQQLVTGFALMLTGWIVYHDHLDSAHFVLTIYLSCLSSSSHLAALITLRRYFAENPTLAHFRICIIALFAILVAISIVLSERSFGLFYAIFRSMGNVFDTLISPGLGVFVSVRPILWLFWTGIWQILPTTRKQFQQWLEKTIWLLCLQAGLRQCAHFMRRHIPREIDARLKKWFWASLEYAFFLGPCTVFLLQIAHALMSIALALAQKFSPGESTNEGTRSCSLNSKGDNEMGYGQILSLLMLTLLVISTIEAYKEEERATSERERVEEATIDQPPEGPILSPRRLDTEQMIGMTPISRRRTE